MLPFKIEGRLGVMVIDCSAGPVTVSWTGAETTAPAAALRFAMPPLIPVAMPLLLMVAIPGLSELNTSVLIGGVPLVASV